MKCTFKQNLHLSLPKIMRFSRLSLRSFKYFDFKYLLMKCIFSGARTYNLYYVKSRTGTLISLNTFDHFFLHQVPTNLFFDLIIY